MSPGPQTPCTPAQPREEEEEEMREGRQGEEKGEKGQEAVVEKEAREEKMGEVEEGEEAEKGEEKGEIGEEEEMTERGQEEEEEEMVAREGAQEGVRDEGLQGDNGVVRTEWVVGKEVMGEEGAEEECGQSSQDHTQTNFSGGTRVMDQTPGPRRTEFCESQVPNPSFSPSSGYTQVRPHRMGPRAGPSTVPAREEHVGAGTTASAGGSRASVEGAHPNPYITL